MSYSRIAGSGASESFVVNVDDSFHKATQAELLRGNVNALAGQNVKGMFLGGSRSQYVFSASEIIVPEWWDVVVDWRHIGGLTVRARVEVYTTNAGTSVTPRIKNVTDAANTDGSASTSVSWSEQLITLPTPGALGLKRYRLYLIGSNATNGIAGMGQIEIFDALY